MRPVSAAWDNALRGSHQMCARARLCPPGQFGVNPYGIELNIVDGDVVFDATADIRATLSLTVANDWPKSTDTTTLAPYGNEIFVERGIVHSNRTREWVALGYYRIYDVEQSDAPSGTLRIAGRDRMSGLIDGKVLYPSQYAALTSVGSVVDSLGVQVYPSLVTAYDFSAYTTRFGSSHIIDEDRFGFLMAVAESQGKLLYFGYDGGLRCYSAPSPSGPGLWRVDAGRHGVLTQISRKITREGVFNAVVAKGEAPGEAPPVMGVAYDLDPNSPTYFYGGFGPVPTFISSSFFETDFQCRSAANAKIMRTRGLPYSVSFGAIANAALEVFDPIDIIIDSSSLERHVIETLRVPLSPGGTMTGTTRLIQTVV